jgi:thiol-disulfide isomerase/thioredoxin
LPAPARALGADRILSPPQEFIFVDEWPAIKPEDAAIPELDKAQLIAEAEKFVNKYQTFSSWEAKYKVTFRQSPREQGDGTIPEFTSSSQVHTISNGPKWLSQDRKENKGATASVHHKKVTSDGRVVRMILPDVKEGRVKDPSQYRNSGIIPTLVDFLPCLPAESSLASAHFPEVLDILDDPDTKLLPWYTRVGNQTCYVLERTTTLRRPIFRNREEFENWKKNNPEKFAQAGRRVDISPSAKPGDVVVTKTKIRLAVDPQSDFAVSRWALGDHTERPRLTVTTFPLEEIIYGDFHQVANGINIPWQMTYTSYTFDKDGTRKANNQTRVELEEFAVDRQYNPGLFEFDFPDGYIVMDINKGISYTVGDSKQQIDALVAAARRRAAFYDNLRNKEAPALEAYQWVNTAPISLTEQRGRPIVLHFWSLGCAPCMRDMPRLQSEYGHTLESTSGPLFISIHPVVDDNELKQLQKAIDKYGITFPVMVDAPELGRHLPGKTFKKYMEEYITSSSWWMKNPELE